MKILSSFNYSPSSCAKPVWISFFSWTQKKTKEYSFVFSRRNKIIQVWNTLRVSKWWQNIHFWLNYPFKLKSIGYRQAEFQQSDASLQISISLVLHSNVLKRKKWKLTQRLTDGSGISSSYWKGWIHWAWIPEDWQEMYSCAFSPQLDGRIG